MESVRKRMLHLLKMKTNCLDRKFIRVDISSFAKMLAYTSDTLNIYFPKRNNLFKAKTTILKITRKFLYQNILLLKICFRLCFRMILPSIHSFNHPHTHPSVCKRSHKYKALSNLSNIPHFIDFEHFDRFRYSQLTLSSFKFLHIFHVFENITDSGFPC